VQLIQYRQINLSIYLSIYNSTLLQYFYVTLGRQSKLKRKAYADSKRRAQESSI